MSFIRAQKIVRDGQGVIQSGSASLVDAVYDPGRKSGHSRRRVRERLGKVLHLPPDHRSGVFLSPTRGLVEYSCATDAFTPVDAHDPRLPPWVRPREATLHTVFGDAYLLLDHLGACGLLDALRIAFPAAETLGRVLAHVLHGILRDGSRITCDAFVAKSFASYVLPDLPPSSLRSDSRLFSLLGEDASRVAFYRAFVRRMRRDHPEFGKCCYVDSTPLPNSMSGSPLNALCCHGVGSSAVMMRLILVLDSATGLPVWHSVIPGNVLDVNTILKTEGDVWATLGVSVEDLVLDSGYVSAELLGRHHIGTRGTLIARMPARRGYPHRELFREIAADAFRGDGTFVRGGHVYFGARRETRVQGHDVHAYVYVDRSNALAGVHDFIGAHGDEFGAMSPDERDWTMARAGYFVLLSNILASPADLLDQYFARTDIEAVIKTGKEYLDLLPLSKWTDLTARGKILHDIINTIALLLLRARLSGTGISTTELFGRAQALMCFRDRDGYAVVETPTRQLREYCSTLKVELPARVRIEEYASHLLGEKM